MHSVYHLANKYFIHLDKSPLLVRAFPWRLLSVRGEKSLSCQIYMFYNIKPRFLQTHPRNHSISSPYTTSKRSENLFKTRSP